jgi:3-hydroxyisobutyrate dehydrogenase-like beta-hydroxyacid dehydrogenase
LQAAVKELVSKGAKEAGSPSQVAEQVRAVLLWQRLLDFLFLQVDHVVTMLPSSPHVKEVYLNPAKGIISYAIDIVAAR